MVLVELLNWVNNNRVCNDEAVVAGASMGGQVARFALNWMEQNNQCHNTKLYISFDSPHKGANVPLGYQYMVADLAKFSTKAEDNKRNLLRPASKQMLLLHFDDAAAAPLRNAWQAWQGSPNSYPQNLRKVAIANGSKIAKTHKVPAGSEIIETTTGGNMAFSAEMECTSLTGKTRAGRNNVVYYRGRNGILKKNLFITVNNNWPEYDTAPGCGYPFGKKMKEGDKFSLGGINITTTTLHLHNGQEFSAFMPTISTLDVRAAYGSSNLLNNVNLGYNIDLNIAPDLSNPAKYAFDAYYAPDDNEPHVQITDGSSTKYQDGNYYGSDNIDWIIQQLQLVNVLQPTQLSTLHNIGAPNVNKLKSVTVESGGELYFNKTGAVTGITPPAQTQAGIYQINTAGNCVLVKLNSNGTVPGKMVLGDDANLNYKAEVFFKSGSTLELNGGKLVINDGSRLVIEPGATLRLSQNSVIELNGDNAVLEINGTLNIAAGVTFTFVAAPNKITGFVRFNRASMQYITTGLNARIELIGQDITDKIMEIGQNTRLNYLNPSNVGEIRIKDGLVNMKNNSTLYLVKNPDIENVHFKGESISTRYNTVECSGETNRIRYSKFTDGINGLTIIQNSSDQSILGNNIFTNNTTGLRSVNGSIKINNSQFSTNTTGWQMEAGGASETRNSLFNNIYHNIKYTSNSGGVLDLIQTNIINSATGVLFDGPGSLKGNCSYFSANMVGAQMKNNAYADFRKVGTLVPHMNFSNYEHNILFENGDGLDFTDGENLFHCSDIFGLYYAGSTRGTAGISGTITRDVVDVYSSNPHKITNNTFRANKNSWNSSPPAAPISGTVYTQTPFDYRLYYVIPPHTTPYYLSIQDNSPIARPTQQQLDLACGAAVIDPGGGGNSRMAQGTTISSGTYSPAFTGTSQCSQYQPLLQAVQQASGLRTRYNPNGNDYLAFTEIQSALQLVQPDTCREFNELLGQAYRLMRETYTASLVTDSTVTAFNKLALANQVTDVFLSWSQQRADTSGMYYTWMDKALNSYAADDLPQASWALTNAWNFVNATNSSYVQYWTCLLDARRQFNDSTINATEFFALLDSCQATYGNTGGMASKMSKPVQVQNPLKLYPNPAEDKTVVNFDLKQAEPVTIELLDVNGTVLETIRQDETRIGKQDVAMPLGKRKTGIYFIRVYGKNFNQSGRLSIVR